MIGLIGLNQGDSRAFPSPGPSCGLNQKVKGLLPTAVIRSVQRQIRRQSPYQGHPGEIMAFHYHLCSNEDIRFPPGKSGQNLLVPLLFRRGIQIHPQHPGCGKHFPGQFLDLLGSGSEGGDIGGAAGWAYLRHKDLIAAVVAHQPPVFMIGQGHVAMGAAQGLAAGTAGNKIRVAPAINKKHDLFFCLKALLHQLF